MKPLPQLLREIEAAIPLEKKATPGPWVGPWGDTYTVAAFDGGHDWTPEDDPKGDAYPLAQHILPNDAAAVAALRNLASDGGLESLAQAVRESIKTAPRWISVKERFPEKYLIVAVRCRDDSRALGWWTGSRWDRKYEAPVDHWMPLPKSPIDAAMKEGQ